jgi:hypothetical protein
MSIVPFPGALIAGASCRGGEPTRSRSQRRIDTLQKLDRDIDSWVASADQASRASARGRADLVEEPMAVAPDDHRQDAALVDAGVDRRWLDEAERDALGERVRAVTALGSRAGDPAR